MLPFEDRPQPGGVVQRAQEVDARDALGAGQHQGFGAGGDDQDVVGDGPGRGVQFVVGGAQRGHVEAEPQGDVQRLEVDVEGRVLGLAEQDRLRQRGPVVRLVRFGADQRDRAGEALFAQGHGGLHTRHARSGDHDAAALPRLCLLLSGLLVHPSTLNT